MEEKVLWLKLPKNAKYRRVKVAEDGSIGIVYSEECTEKYTCQTKKEITKVKVEIPKPRALVGGSEVYQKDDVPYWYCKIKNGRDEFMHLYMEDLTVEDLLYDSKTGRIRKISTFEQEKFVKNALEALANKPKEGYRWIPVFEPSSDGNGGLQFVKGEKPLVGRNCPEWYKMMEEYSPENESGPSFKTTYFLLLLRWLKDGIVTFEQLTENSEKIGHYRHSKNAKHDLERTGERKFGGLYGFAGNTCKMLEGTDLHPNLKLGGCYDDEGDEYPLSHCESISYDIPDDGTVGFMELKK